MHMQKRPYKSTIQTIILLVVLLCLFGVFMVFHVLDKNTGFFKFTGQTATGTKITEHIFSDYDACVVFCWSPSKESDGTVAKQMNDYYEQLKQDHIGFIGIIVDDSSIEDLQQIKDLKYPNIILEKNNIKSDKMTNYIVSHEGKIIGKSITGNLYLNSSIADQYLSKALGKNSNSCAKANLVVKEKVDLAVVSNQVIPPKKTKNTSKKVTGKITKEKLNTKDLKKRFIDGQVVVMGDSLAMGLIEYNLLDSQSVVAKRGAGMATIDKHIATVSKMLPKIVVLEYGLNDIEYYNGDAKHFIRLYEEKINKIQKQLPDATIYICKVTHIKQSTLKKRPLFKHVDDYNQAIEKLCKRKKISYLSTDYLIDKYSSDGIHPTFSYYKYWAAYIAEVAGI